VEGASIAVVDRAENGRRDYTAQVLAVYQDGRHGSFILDLSFDEVEVVALGLDYLHGFPLVGAEWNEGPDGVHLLIDSDERDSALF
jgi:hypothetical protein